MILKNLEDIKRILELHKEDFRIRYGVKGIGIFGSYIRGEQREDSDIDILIEFEKTVSLLKVVSLENYLNDLLEMRVDVVPHEDVRAELQDEIFREAVYI